MQDQNSSHLTCLTWLITSSISNYLGVPKEIPLVDFKFVDIWCSDVDGVGRNIFISRNNGNMISWDLIS